MTHRIRPRLGVNIDHVATIRQARGTNYPDPVAAAALAELAGADQITIHLREDRRHIQDRDLAVLRETVKTRLNLEMGATAEMAEIARRTRPHMVTLVPEKRAERTTEGGLDITARQDVLQAFVADLKAHGCVVSMFIDPEPSQVEASHAIGAQIVELHTGDYCAALDDFESLAAFEAHQQTELERLRDASARAANLGLMVAAGHGLDYKNVLAVAAIPQIEEFNIGHSIVARAVLVGLERAVREMIEALEKGRAYGA